MPEEGPSPERIRAALEELLGWQGIARSPQLAELLRYVVEKTLSGEGASIKAYSIAVDVFGRPADFDPQSDPIVRVQARRLRTLLEQFYEGGTGTADVQIHLPLGRYVPDFSELPTKQGMGADKEPRPGTVPERKGPPRLSRFLVNALLGLLFTLVGVGLAIALTRWFMPQPGTAVAMPEQPRVTIGTFDNLTGEPLLDDDVSAVGEKLAQALSRFDMLTIGSGGPTISGTVQQTNGQFVLRAMLVQPDVRATSWTATIMAPTGVTDTTALAAASLTLAAQLGNASGPLHATGRSWLDLQASLPSEPNPYVCDLVYMKWRDSRRIDEADRGIACLEAVLRLKPDDALSLAALAGIQAWRTEFLALPGDDLSALMTSETAAVSRAVSLGANSSFVYEQQAIVLTRQGSVDAALGAISRARELNPANMDAASVQGTLQWIAGQYGQAARHAEEALAAIPFAPSWYYLTRAFNALREQRFFDAIDAAQALAAGDEEFGPVIALAAAPRAGRSDLIDRYRPLVMSNPRFQATGILPRLAIRVRVPAALQGLREGLILAGIPVTALDGPFNADGSGKTPTVP